MMIVHPSLSHPIEFKENTVNVITIENSVLYRNLLQELLAQYKGDAGTWVLSDSYTPLEIAKEAEVITDVFNLNIFSKTLLSNINKKAEKISEELEITPKLLSYINSFGAEIVSGFDFDLSFLPLESVSSVIKALNFFVDLDDVSLPEKLIEYIKISVLLLKKRLFVILNLKSILTAQELKLFYKSILFEKVNLLLLETHQTPCIPDYEKNLIIDYDLCEI